jgi:ACS family tartrate transporter-like MFS transporter
VIHQIEQGIVLLASKYQRTRAEFVKLSRPTAEASIFMNEEAGRRLVTRAALRLVPFLLLLYVIAYLDRVNVSFAQLQMKQLLHLDDQAYGLGAGIFFLGYFLFEIPSNLILERVGARRWIARIMFTWGLIAMAMMFTRNAFTFCALRFLLGLAEAGFFPGILLYMTYWFTAAERARIIAWFMTANAIAFIIGNPLSGKLLTIHAGGLAGWQWLFLVEGLPSVLLSGVVLARLPDNPAAARWLTASERDWLQARVRADHAHREKHGAATLRAALLRPDVWLLCALYFTMVVGMYGLSLWLPQIVKGFSGMSDWQLGLVTAIPYIAAGIGMVLSATHSDRTGERRLHVAIPAVIGAIGLIISARQHTPAASLAALTLASTGMWATLGPFWSLPTGLLSGTAAAGGIALVNSVGNLGGFVGPYLVGFVKQRGSFEGGLYTLAGSLILSSVIVLFVKNPDPPST